MPEYHFFPDRAALARGWAVIRGSTVIGGERGCIVRYNRFFSIFVVWWGTGWGVVLRLNFYTNRLKSGLSSPRIVDYATKFSL